MIEKQETYLQDHDWKTEEKNRASDSSWEKMELEREIDIAQLMHKEVTGYDRKEMKSHSDDFPSTKSSREADECSEPRPASKSRFVIQLTESSDSFEDKSQSKPSHASDPEANNDAAASSRQMKERTASKPRKKRRPQSLNLGMPAELIYEKGSGDSTEEENEDSESDNSPEEDPKTGNHCESPAKEMMRDDEGSVEDQSGSVFKDSRQEDMLLGESGAVSTLGTEQVKRKSQFEPADVDSDSVNGLGKMEHDSSLTGIKGECAMKMRGRGLIDNKELAEVKLRQVRTHEMKVSSSGGEGVDGFTGGQRTSLHRLSGSSCQSEISRIVPLKPERSKSVAGKDERDDTGQDELTRVLRREHRWSVGSPERSLDLAWTDGAGACHPSFAGDLEGTAKTDHTEDGRLYARGPVESQSFGSKISSLHKMAPPAPPVKTQKARESGLILRNSRTAGGREPSLDAAKKRHSVTLLGIRYSVIGVRASHELQTD